MKPSKTVRNLGNGLRQEIVRHSDGSGRSTKYKDGLIFRDVKEVTRWKGK